MVITTFFSTENETPASGLIPTITIQEIPSGVVVVNSALMSEIGNGFYSYDFTNFDSSKEYVFLCASNDSNSDPYTYGSTMELSTIYSIKDTVENNDIKLDNTITEINQNETKIDNLQNDINLLSTGQNDIVTEINQNETKIDTLISGQSDIQTDISNTELNLTNEINQNETKIDNLISGQSDITTEINQNETKIDTLVSGQSNIVNEIDNNETKIDNLQTDVTNIDNNVSLMDGKVDNVQSDVDNIEINLTNLNSTVSGQDTKLDDILTNIQFLIDVEGGAWKIDEITNEMIFYKADNTTEIMRFNLYDLNGLPSHEVVAERRRK